MAIVGATDKESLDRGRRPALVGRLWKGSPKQQKTRKDGTTYDTFGKDLSFFRFEGNTPEVTDAFLSKYGKEPAVLRAILPFDTVDLCCPTFVEGYDNRGKIHYQSDGVMTSAIRIGNVWSTRKRDQRPVSELSQFTAKWIYRLYLVFPALWEAGHPGAVLLKSQSKHDCVNITASLWDMEKSLHRQGQTLKGHEVVLWRSLEQIKTPDGMRIKKNLVRLLWAKEYDDPLMASASVSLDAETEGDLEEDDLLVLDDGTQIDTETGEILDEEIEIPESARKAALMADAPKRSDVMKKRAVEELGYKAWKHAQNVVKKYNEGRSLTIAGMWVILVDHAPALAEEVSEDPEPETAEPETLPTEPEEDTDDLSDIEVPF